MRHYLGVHIGKVVRRLIKPAIVVLTVPQLLVKLLQCKHTHIAK